MKGQFSGEVRGLSVDERTVDVIASTNSPGRDGAIVDLDAWDLSSYQRNPVVMWAHERTSMPIARAIRTEVTERGLEQTHKFATHAEAERVFQAVQDGIVNSVSVRWHTKKISRINQRIHVRDAELIETSYVPIPVDTGAVVLRGDTEAVVDLSDYAEEQDMAEDIVEEVSIPDQIKEAVRAVMAEWPKAEPPAPVATVPVAPPQPPAQVSPPPAPPAPPVSPPTIAATDRVRNTYDQRGYTRSDYEIAGVILGVTRVPPSDEFQRSWSEHVVDRPSRDSEKYGSQITMRLPDTNTHERAMTTSGTGLGLELMGTAYETELWDFARNRDPLINMIRTIPLRQHTQVLPIAGALPSMTIAGESPSADYPRTNVGSNRVVQESTKFTIQSEWSAELEEDAIIEFAPFVRQQMMESYALHLASAYYNGDTTTGGTGNIVKDDGAPASGKHYLAWDGIRHNWLVDATGQGINAGGALTIADIFDGRLRLGGSSNDVDGGLDNVDWSTEVSDLLLVCDRDTYYNLQQFSEVVTLEKYGPGATIQTGELGRIAGIRILSPAYASKTQADGKASDTPANNTLGQISFINTKGWIAGIRRGVEFRFDYIQGRDMHLLEMYTRNSFNKISDKVSSGIRNITV